MTIGYSTPGAPETDSTSAHPPKNLDALRAAQLYYLQDQTMETIAHELRTSRSSVSRLLSHARATGLVEIHVKSPLDQTNQLQRDLHERYGITSHIVPISGQISDIDRLERVAITAARLLVQFMDSNMIMGIAWGSTISAISRHLADRPTQRRRQHAIDRNRLLQRDPPALRGGVRGYRPAVPSAGILRQELDPRRAVGGAVDPENH
jgi:predicted DNA-binding protein YlxM (UPF0122 family)